MIVSVGTDLVEISRIERLLDEGRDRFLARVFTPREREYCDARPKPAESFAARFAAKEAVMKCLGTGWSEGVGFGEIEVTRDENGAVGVALSGKARERARAIGIGRVLLSISHADRQAVAFAVAVRA